MFQLMVLVLSGLRQERCRYDVGGVGMSDEAMKQTGMKNWRMNLQWGRLYE